MRRKIWPWILTLSLVTAGVGGWIGYNLRGQIDQKANQTEATNRKENDEIARQNITYFLAKKDSVIDYYKNQLAKKDSVIADKTSALVKLTEENEYIKDIYELRQ
jgi:uncharacterized protein with NRDE domain